MAATPLGIAGAVGDFSHSVVIRKNAARRSHLDCGGCGGMFGWSLTDWPGTELSHLRR